MNAAAILGAILLAGALLPGATGTFHEQMTQAPERAFALLMTGTTFNGLHAGEHPLLEAYAGERVTFMLAATEAHTFHLHGHPWLLEDGRIVDTFLVGPETPHRFDVRAGGLDAHPGDWMYHCHVQEHLDGGMWGVLRVYPFAARVLPGPVPVVALDAQGSPLDGATLTLALDGAPLTAHVQPLGHGRYALHADLPASGTLVVTAEHPALGTSVARHALGGGAPETPTLAHEGHP